MSLEGLGALIQLESTRLEGARQTSQNFQQANSAVQQVGAQTAQAKTGIWTQKIEANYSKEVQEATVRKLESKLARERKAEHLAMTIATGVTAISALSNAWDGISDIVNQTQKLGDIPNYLKVPEINPSEGTVVNVPNSKDTGSTTYAVGENGAVYSMKRGIDGSMKDERAANIGAYDIKTIVGNDPAYQKLFKENGNKDLSFLELAKKSPELADKVMQDKSHSMGRTESANFVAVLKAQVPSGKIIGINNTAPPPTVDEVKKAKKAITEAVDNANKLAGIQTLLPTEVNGDGVDKVKKEPEIKVGGQAIKIGEIKVDGKPITELTPKELESNGFDKKLADAMQLAQTAALFNETKIPQNYSIIMSGNNVTLLNKDANPNTSTTIKLNSIDAEKFRNNINNINSKDEKGKTSETNAKASLLTEFNNELKNPKNEITVATGDQEAAHDFQVRVDAPTTCDVAIDTLKGLHKLDKNHDSTLGKAFDMVSEVGHAGFNFIVNTAKDAAPYFQAYLAQKGRADSAEEELMEARQKLAAENKKLKNIQMQIDLFNGRGS